MSDSVLDSHDKMRSRDVGRVARGEQAPRPPHEFGTVSKPPPPSSTEPKPKTADAPRLTNQLRNCCIRYYEYHKCIQENEKDPPKCEKFAKEFRTLCPSELIEKWDEEKQLGLFPGPL